MGKYSRKTHLHLPTSIVLDKELYLLYNSNMRGTDRRLFSPREYVAVQL
jgi:hypothetical protein